MPTPERLAEQFETYRPHVRAVAYRMLGSVSEAEDAEATTFSKLALSNQVVLVNGNIGLVSRRPDGQQFSVLGFTVAGDKVAEIDILADPDRLSRLDLSAIER